jgi:hypothetical protein
VQSQDAGYVALLIGHVGSALLAKGLAMGKRLGPQTPADLEAGYETPHKATKSLIVPERSSV